MQVYPFILQFTPSTRQILIRELCGQDELAPDDAGSISAIRLLNGLLLEPDSAHEILRAEKMVTADRDRLLALLYKHTYGSKVQSTVLCQFCSGRFDLDFSLDDLLAHIQPEEKPTNAERLDDGTYHMANGVRFRLPCGEDELAIMGLPVQQAEQLLLERCLLEGNPVTDGEAVQQAMEQIAPVLQTEMMSQCPECRKEQPVYFNLQSFLLARLRNEKKQVASEVHRLATAYRWSHKEILGLPRSLRRTYVAFIESDWEAVQNRFT